VNVLESLAYIINACATVLSDHEASSNRSRLEDVLRGHAVK